jgi:hypothetical protein
MRLFPLLRIGVPIAALCLCLHGQTTQTTEPQTETKGLPPRATPADYQTQVQAGAVTIAAEFKGHAVPTLQKTLTTEDYVAVEAALFGSPGARLKLSFEDFSIRINARKTPLPASPYGLVVGSLRDPDWEPPEAAESKSKTSVHSGDTKVKRAEGNEAPPPVKIPVPLQRAMAQQVQKASLPEGDRPLPQAGLLFFLYRGKTQNIQSIELIYAGAAGKATLNLQP